MCVLAAVARVLVAFIFAAITRVWGSSTLGMRWVLGSLRMREGDSDGAIEYLRDAITAFEALKMHGDAALVRLEITEELLRRGRWQEAELLVSEAASTFARNDARLHVAAALAYLRECVISREATPALVERLRGYIDADDEAIPFSSLP